MLQIYVPVCFTKMSDTCADNVYIWEGGAGSVGTSTVPWLTIITSPVSAGGDSGVVGEPWNVVRGCFCSSSDVVWPRQSEPWVGRALLSFERLRMGEGIITLNHNNRYYVYGYYVRFTGLVDFACTKTKRNFCKRQTQAIC